MAASLTIFCDAEYSCMGAAIHCPEFGKCYIYCHAQFSCAYATVHGPTNERYIMECHGAYGCASKASLTWNHKFSLFIAVLSMLYILLH